MTRAASARWTARRGYPLVVSAPDVCRIAGRISSSDASYKDEEDGKLARSFGPGRGGGTE
jgi:hypothetical protein